MEIYSLEDIAVKVRNMLKETIKIPMLKIAGRSIPRVLMGSSPFIGAGQFGYKAFGYAKKFLGNPENIVNLYGEAMNIGVKGYHLLGEEKVVNAFLKAVKVHGEIFYVIGTVGMGSFKREMELLAKVEPGFLALHAMVFDKTIRAKRFIDKLFVYMDEIKESGAVPGVATHRPGETIPLTDELNLPMEFYLAPVNKTGIFMEPAKEKTLKAVKNTKKAVIAMKCLAAGKINPEEAFRYIFSETRCEAAAVGIASSRELTETFKAAQSVLSKSFR